MVERNRKEAMVVVDGARKGQVKEPRGPVRPMLLNKNLYIGNTTCLFLFSDRICSDDLANCELKEWIMIAINVNCRSNSRRG